MEEVLVCFGNPRGKHHQGALHVRCTIYHVHCKKHVLFDSSLIQAT